MKNIKIYNPFVVWFSGLSGAGKSTIAHDLASKLREKGISVYVLDGDKLRTGINKDLGFSPADREENLRRAAEIAALMKDAGFVVLAAFITPSNSSRKLINQIIGRNNTVQVYVNASIEQCEKRDTKGLYKKARNGEIQEFTGISAPFEEPDNSDLVLYTDHETKEQSVSKVLQLVDSKIEKL